MHIHLNKKKKEAWIQLGYDHAEELLNKNKVVVFKDDRPWITLYRTPGNITVLPDYKVNITDFTDMSETGYKVSSITVSGLQSSDIEDEIK